MGMRGFGQIAELAAIAEPDVGVITNIGPVHLEQMGSLEGVAQAKAELLAGLYDGATAVVPSDEPLLEPWLREALTVVTFGPGGDVAYEGSSLRGGAVPDAVPSEHVILAGGERIELELPFDQAHNLLNTLAAVAAARAVGVTPGGRARRALLAACAASASCSAPAPPSSTTATTPTRCPCAPPSTTSPPTRPTGRRLAVLGDMLELGPAEDEHHRDVGAYAATAGVDVLVTVGPRAAQMLDAFDGEGYAVGDRAARRPRSPGTCWRRATCCSSRARAASASRSSPRRWRRARASARPREPLMGEVLIAGTASLLICIFLSPKFISYLRRREFGQQIREEGPQEHHAKAGTPTMGGIIIFTAIAVPFLLLTDFDPRSVGVFGVAVACALLGFADDYVKVARRRSLGLRGRTKLDRDDR